MLKKIKNLFNKFSSNNFAVFIFFLVLIFFAYHNLFNSYFESDEWFYFTYYFPLTKQPLGLLTAIFSNFTKSGYISGGQHVVPIASLIYFLNTKFFGLNFVPYALMSLMLHAINSYLVFILTKTLLNKKSGFEKNMYALLSSIFFALSPVPMHAITGFAAFYGQNVLSVTFFLLCVFFYEQSFIKKERKFILFTVIFLFLALLTQESTFFLFFLLPFMSLFRNKVFSYTFLGVIFFSCLIFYVIIRFFIPNILSLHFHTTHIDNAPDISIYKNLPAEILFRSITFPLKMAGSIFFPRDTVFSVVQFLTPVISPYPPGGAGTVQSVFVNYTGPSMIIYLMALCIIIFCFVSIIQFVHKKKYEEAHSIAIGLAILLFGALPLVAIIFTFPLWGYDIYFDSRHYYNPEVGAAILFPFLMIGIARFISRSLHIKRLFIVSVIVFFVWLTNNTYAFGTTIHLFTENYSADRKKIVKQLTDYLPKLKSKTVFYIASDGNSPFTSLPFFTSVPQALTVVYYNRSPLPDNFYNKSLFSGKPEGYQYENGRGFGYYISKKELLNAIIANKFSANDVYGFYYYGKDAKIRDITIKTRTEIKMLSF